MKNVDNNGNDSLNNSKMTGYTLGYKNNGLEL